MTGARPRRGTDVVARRVAGETFLVPIRGRLADVKGLYALNSVGSFVWERLDGTVDVQEIARAVAGEFDVALETAAVDVGQMIGALEDLGFIEGGN